MPDRLIKLLLMLLILFTPIAFGSIDVWAFSIMELLILSILVLWAVGSLLKKPEASSAPAGRQPQRPRRSLPWVVPILLTLFLLLVFVQWLRLPLELVRILSPQAYLLQQALNYDFPTSGLALSLVPFATQIEFFKWLTLAGLFLFLIRWKGLERKDTRHLILVILAAGILESLYGIFEFFSGHRYILNLPGGDWVTAVTGTFINSNYFAGYLLMVIPLSVAYLLSGSGMQEKRSMGWRAQFSSVDAKTLLLGFGTVVMILALLFSSSRMGVVSLLVSFTLTAFFFRGTAERSGSSKLPVLLLGLAVLWAVGIGLDAVISRFFTASEDFDSRWRVWANTFQVLKDFPILGSGLGTFAHVFPMYRSFYLRGLVTHAENDFLQLASEVGLIGIGLLAAVFVVLLVKAISRIRSLSPEDPQRYIRVAGMVGILALMFHSLVERNIQIPANAFLYTVIWALVLKTSRERPPLGDRGKPAVRKVHKAVGFIPNEGSLPS